MCKIANVSKSGYYYWLKNNENSQKMIKNEEDILLIAKIFYQKKRKAGWRTIKMILENEYGKIINHKKIIKIMKKYDLKTNIRKKRKVNKIPKIAIDETIYQNVLNRDFEQQKPNVAYCTDISYLPYQNKNIAYLSALKDIASGEIVAYTLSKTLKLDFVIKMIKKAIELTPDECLDKLILHSDRGVHYRSNVYQKLLKKYGITQSMSRKANCLDNAPIESFFGHLKDDIDYKKCKTFEELEDMVKNYVYNYNNNRYQWNKNKMTPIEYKQYLLAA